MSTVRQASQELVGLYWESGVSADIPALAWYLLSSLVPLALGLTALAAVALGDYAEAQALAARLSHALPKDAHDQIVALILRTKKDSPFLIAGAIAGMVWTSSGAVGVLDRCLSRMLSIRSPKPVLGLVRNLGLAFAVAVLVVMMVLLATVSWHAALAGGGVSGLILLITPTLAGYYTRWVAGNTPVKAFLVLAGVLITCYIAAVGLLLGAGVAARVQLGHAPDDPDPRLPRPV